MQAHVDMEVRGTNVPSMLRLAGRRGGVEECTQMLAGTPPPSSYVAISSTLLPIPYPPVSLTMRDAKGQCPLRVIWWCYQYGPFTFDD